MTYYIIAELDEGILPSFNAWATVGNVLVINIDDNYTYRAETDCKVNYLIGLKRFDGYIIQHGELNE